MKTLLMAAVVAASTVAAGIALAQGTQQDLKAMEKMGQRDDMQAMTPAQQADYKAQYDAAKAQWAKMTPDQQKAAIESARQKKLKDLSYAELVGQRDDMQQESAAQSGALRAQSDIWKSKWNSLTPEQKQAVRKASWEKKREELSGIEAVGQRDDTYVLPW
jgi:hypothetical protein